MPADKLNQLMTPLANAVRTLSGDTSTKGVEEMTSDISTANTDIETQTSLINQITIALAGKVAGGANGTVNICTFTVNNLKFNDEKLTFCFLEGWTWDDFIHSPLNMKRVIGTDTLAQTTEFISFSGDPADSGVGFYSTTGLKNLGTSSSWRDSVYRADLIEPNRNYYAIDQSGWEEVSE